MPNGKFEKPPEIKPKKEEEARVSFETREGEKFFVERLTSPEDPRVEKVQEMLAGYFGKKEVDPIEVMKQAMTGKMKTGEEVPPYLIHEVENSKGEIKGLYTGAVVETVSKKGKKGNVSEKYGIQLGCYSLVAPEERGKGLWKELFKAQEEASKKDAERRGLKIKGTIGEAHNNFEPMLNKQGIKRAYIKAEDGSFRELPYEQPPVDWNIRTGKPMEGAGTVPEHLMLKLASGKDKLSGKSLMEMVRGMYYYNNYREEEYFKNEKAYQRHTEFVEGVEGKLADFIGKKAVHLLSREERETMGNKGVKFIEHKTEAIKKAQQEKAVVETAKIPAEGMKPEQVLKEVGIQKPAESFEEVQKRLDERIEKARIGGEKLSLADRNEMTRDFYLGELGYSVKYKGLLRGKAELLDEAGKAITDEKDKPMEFKTFFKLGRKETPMIDFLKERLKEKLEGKPVKELTEEEKWEAGFQKAVKSAENEQAIREGKISVLQEAKEVGTKRLSKLFNGLAYIAGFDRMAAPVFREGKKLAVEGGRDLAAIGLTPAAAVEEAGRYVSGRIQVGEALRKIAILGALEKLPPEKRQEYYTDRLEEARVLSERGSEELIKGLDRERNKGKILKLIEILRGRLSRPIGRTFGPPPLGPERI